MLEGVEHQDQAAIGQMYLQRRDDRLTRLPQSDGRCDRRGHEGGIGDRAERDKNRVGSGVLPDPMGRLYGEPGLADTAGPGKASSRGAVVDQRRGDQLQLALSAEQWIGRQGGRISTWLAGALRRACGGFGTVSGSSSPRSSASAIRAAVSR